MALAQVSHQTNGDDHPDHPSLEGVTICCDKLRLRQWKPCGFTLKQFGEDTIPFTDYYQKRGRNQGRRHVKHEIGHWFGRRGDEGNVWLRCTEGEIVDSITVEFNPQKVARMFQPALWAALDAISPRGDWLVDRYDIAINYPVHRSLLLLDDPTRKADLFSIRPRGPETERTGYRKGSKLKASLYWKTGERKAKGQQTDGDVTRFELQVWPNHGERASNPLRLAGLPDEPWPGGKITVRCLEFNPGSIADPLCSVAAVAARYHGVKFARAKIQQLADKSKREVFDWCVVPEARPSPTDVYKAGWFRVKVG